MSRVENEESMSQASTRKETASWKRELAAVAVVALVAVAVRVVYLMQYKASSPYYSAPILDSCYYDLWAQRVAHGGGYGPKPFYLAPLYPYFLALIYRVAGRSLAVVYVVQSVLGVVSTILVYLLGRKLFGRTAGILSALCAVMYAPLIFTESKILGETLGITLGLTAMLLLLHAVRRQTFLAFMAAGAVAGLSAVCRPVVLLFVALTAVWLLLRTPRKGRAFYAKQLAPFVIGAVMFIAPVTIRNYVIGKDPALISTNAGITFAQGNTPAGKGLVVKLPGFGGDILTQQKDEMAVVTRALGHPVTPSESSAYWFRVILRSAARHPIRYLQIVGYRFLWSLHYQEMSDIYNVYVERNFIPVLRLLAMPFPLLAGLALFGVIRARGLKIGQPAFPPALYALSILISLLIFQVNSRYRLPMVPALAVFAGFGLLELAGVFRSWNIRRAVSAAACIVPVLLVSAIAYPSPKVTADGLNNLGVSYLSVGKTDEAAAAMEEALRLDPHYAPAHENLAELYMRLGSPEKAIPHFEQMLLANPRDAAGHNTLGILLAQTGNIGEAVVHLREAVRLNPRDADSHNNLAITLSASGKPEEAVRHYHEALRLKPNSPQVAGNLAWILATCKNPKIRNGTEAVTLAEEACRADKGNPRVLNTLAAAYAEAGRFDEAAKTAQTAVHLAESAQQTDLARLIRWRVHLYQSHRPLHCNQDGSGAE